MDLRSTEKVASSRGIKFKTFLFIWFDVAWTIFRVKSTKGGDFMSVMYSMDLDLSHFSDICVINP